MRGFPFFNFLLCLLLSGAVVLPLVLRATHIAPRVAPAPQTAADEEMAAVPVTVRFVHAPRSLKISNGDNVLAEWQNSSSELLWEQKIRLPKGPRVEFALAVQWPDNTPDTVAVVTVEPDSLTAKTENLWSTGPEADGVLSFSWEGPQP